MRSRAHGVTLIELLLVVLVVLALVMVAQPAFNPLLESSRGAASINQILGAANTARQQAITRRETITLCAGRTRCAGRADWHLGTIGFADRNHNGDLDNGEPVILRTPGWQHGGRVSWRGFRARSWLRFTPRGFTAWQNGSFIYCPGSADARGARRVVLNAAGRSYRATDTDGDGIIDGPGGRPLQCPIT